MPSTWQELIKLALIEIGVLVAGETPDTEDLNLGLSRLRMMLDIWAIEGLLVNGFLRLTRAVDPAKTVYTIAGANPDIPATSPPSIVNAVGYQGRDSKLRYLVRRTTQELLYAGSQVDSKGVPTLWAYDDASPQATLRLNAPGWQGDTLTIIGRGAVVDGTIELDDDPALPTGYSRAVMLNLAIELAGSFAVPDSKLRVTAKLAFDAKSSVRAKNLQPMQMIPDPSNLDGRGSFLRRRVAGY